MEGSVTIPSPIVRSSVWASPLIVMLCLKWPRPFRFFKQPYSNTLDFLAAKVIFETHNAYNIMIIHQVMRKTTICMGENEGEDQPRGYRKADQRLCF